MPFRTVNRRGSACYDAALQRHHLLPRQILTSRAFARFLDHVPPSRLGFHDFRRNGMLLPCRESAALRSRLPLHRGPHRAYNAMVEERMGQIQARWQRTCARQPELARDEAIMRVGLLQRALRRRLLTSEGKRPLLNRMDPLGAGLDFRELDAMVDMLWHGTAPVEANGQAAFWNAGHASFSASR